MALSFADGGCLWRRDALAQIFEIIVGAGCLTVGAAAYAGIRAAQGGKAGPPAGFRRAWRDLFLLFAAEAACGLLFGAAIAIYAAWHGLGSVGPGTEAGVVVFGGFAGMLLLVLLAGIIPCGAACAMGMTAGANLASAPPRPSAVGTVRHDAGDLRIAAAVVVFAAVNAAVFYWVRHDFGGNASTKPMFSLFQTVLEFALIGDLWASAVVLWFLWFRKYAAMPLWRKVLLLLPSLAVAAIAARFTP